ncbi:MAG: hypothetical protein ACOC5K_04640, partial [Chloroflexota bacterium]
MPALKNRIGTLRKSLTAGERALMIYHALCEGREVDPEIARDAPAEQRRELGSLTGIVEGVQTCLWPLAGVLASEAQALRLRCGLLVILRAWANERRELADLAEIAAGEDFQGDENREAAMDAVGDIIGRGPGVLEEELAKDDSEEEGRSFGAVARVSADAVRRDLPAVWGRLLALEAVHEEALAELGAGDVMAEEMRHCMESARADLELVSEEARKMLPEIALPAEPEAAVHALLRERVFQGKRSGFGKLNRLDKWNRCLG